ncbi:hypothetical protein V6N13_074371 [Hibiscus sabdariffa]
MLNLIYEGVWVRRLVCLPLLCAVVATLMLCYHWKSVVIVLGISVRGVSDHAPIRLRSGYVDWGPKSFRFLNCWLEKRGHVKLMEKEWCRIGEESDSVLSILDKLHLLKAFLKVWNRKSFGSVDLQIKVMTE